jgi:hypothetical protein
MPVQVPFTRPPLPPVVVAGILPARMFVLIFMVLFLRL